LGVLAIAAASPTDFGAQAVFLETLASEVAIGLKNARLYEQSRQYVRQLQENMVALNQSKKEWQEIFQAIGSPTLILDSQFRILSANRAALTATGQSEEELHTKTCFEVFHLAEAPPDKCPLQTMLHTATFEVAEMEVEALQRTFLVSCTPVLDEAGNVEKIIHIATDVTEIKQAEEALKESEEKYRLLVENAGEAIFALNAAGIFLFMNNMAARELGGLPEDFLGKTLWDVFPREVAERQFQGLCEIMRSGQGRIMESETILQDERCWYRTNGQPLKNASGNTYAVMFIGTDITERKRSEAALQKYSEELEAMVKERTQTLRDTQEKLLRQERLAALGQLAGGVGHELRTPLSTISNAVYFLKMKLQSADTAIREYLDIIKNQVRKGEKIIADLLDFSRVKSLERREIKVDGVVNRVLETQEFPDSIQVTVDIPKDLPALFADSTHIEQVLGNLIANACQAMPEGGTLAINARLEGGMVAIDVHDTGSGIAPEHLKKVFEPLFTTKAKGIGLGLAVCKNLIEANNGTITVKSEEGKGATFTLCLPAGKEEAQDETRS
jgi:PAS domain S-box-containing protein